MNRLRTSEVELLLETLARLDNSDEVYAFLQDLCTVRELQDMSQRLHVASLLADGESYVTIQETTGASATTISRVSKALNYGADGYRMVLEQLAEIAEARENANGTEATQ